MKTVLKGIFNILFWITILVSKQNFTQDFHFLPTEIFFLKNWDLLEFQYIIQKICQTIFRSKV